MKDIKTVLLIDDESDFRELVKLALEAGRYQVTTAGNGIEGLRKLKSARPDLIVLDMNMPKMGGIEFYRHICDGYGRPLHPVLVLTARANMEQLFRQFNIDGFMAKPFEIEDLLREVDAILRNREGRPSDRASSGSRATPQRACIVDNDPAFLGEIGAAFLSGDYIVTQAKNGVEGIEAAAATVPDVILIKLGLMDMPGDMVAMKLKYMTKTKGIKCVVYTERAPEKTAIAGKIGEKTGIDRLVEYNSPRDLLAAANEVLKQREEMEV